MIRSERYEDLCTVRFLDLVGVGIDSGENVENYILTCILCRPQDSANPKYR